MLLLAVYVSQNYNRGRYKMLCEQNEGHSFQVERIPCATLKKCVHINMYKYKYLYQNLNVRL